MTGLSLGGLPRGSGPNRERSPEDGQLRGNNFHVDEGISLEDLKRLLREQQYRCFGCQSLIPEPEFDLEIEGAKVYPRGPVLVGVEEGGDHGFIDRKGRWFCLACGVNHPGGVAVRKIALQLEWGFMMAWDSAHPRLGWAELALAMHQAVESGAVSALTRLLVGGYKAGDIWTLPDQDRHMLARNPRLRGFPLKRPGPLHDRVQWSGPLLAEGVDHTTVHRLLDEQKVFVLLASEALGLERRQRPAAPPARVVPAPVVAAGIEAGLVNPEPKENTEVQNPISVSAEAVEAAASTAAATARAVEVVEGLDPFNLLGTTIEASIVEEAPRTEEVVGQPTSAIEEEPLVCRSAGEEILGIAGPPPGMDEGIDEEPPD